MDDRAAEKLNKVLALTESAHDGEALAALRVTRSLLRQSGHSLSHLIRDGVRRDGKAPAAGVGIVRPSAENPPADIVDSLQREVVQLQRRVQEMQARLFEQQKEINYWRNRAENSAGPAVQPPVVQKRSQNIKAVA